MALKLLWQLTCLSVYQIQFLLLSMIHFFLTKKTEIAKAASPIKNGCANSPPPLPINIGHCNSYQQVVNPNFRRLSYCCLNIFNLNSSWMKRIFTYGIILWLADYSETDPSSQTVFWICHQLLAFIQECAVCQKSLVYRIGKIVFFFKKKTDYY